MSLTPQNQNSGGGLEDRLRGLILNNSQPVPLPQNISQANPRTVLASNAPGFEQVQPQYNKQDTVTRLPSAPQGSAQSTPSGKKRMNQAHRRQMNSQRSIPINAAPSQQERSTGRGFSSVDGLPSPTGGWSQSTDFASPARRYGPHNTPLSHGGQNNQSSHIFQKHSPASPYPTQMQFQQPYPPLPMQQMHTHQQTQHGYRQNSESQSTGLMDPNQWRGPGHQFRQQQQQYISRPTPQSPQLYQPSTHNYRPKASYGFHPEQLAMQSTFLEGLLNKIIPQVEISAAEVTEKEEFRAVVEQICRNAIAKFEQEVDPKFDPSLVQLKCFGSMSSGFATKASDMDLALLSPMSYPPPDSSESSIPRILEKSLLEKGFGARLLTRTRVPIIKLCQRPTLRLMSDMLEERSKWENGFNVEEPGEEPASPGALADEKIHEHSTGTRVEDSGKEAASKSPDEICQEQLSSFCQKKNQSLGDYYGSAKRLLRKLGGRDITAGQVTVSPEEVKILEDVCKAFVNGLTDTILRDRLFTYQSLAFNPVLQQGTDRSLTGVYAQIEGENLAMRWDSRPLAESTANQDTHCAQEIMKWQKLLNSTYLETSQYNRTLHNSVERLKRIPSLQLIFLEQAQHEDAAQYYSRTAKLLLDLGVADHSDPENQKLGIVISHYISGARSSKIRDTLELVSAQNPQISLKSLALHQRALELADDYEVALSKKLYSDEDRKDIEKYVSIVREGIASSQGSPTAPLPLTRATAALITKLRSLPNPSQVHKSRDRYSDHLEFRNKDNIGIQCDINFSAQLALQNTLLLRCYSLTDSRVKPLILFVKHWAKLRAINTPYRGTLSSYGYVLMVLHYLTNVATPFVCPNLQHIRRQPPETLPPGEAICNGCDVQFWRNEKEIASLAERELLNHNKDSIGILLRGFFEYYAFNGSLSTSDGVGFDWMRNTLSLRTVGGILTKNEKGWTGARTVIETTTESAPSLSSAPLTSSPSTNLSIDAATQIPATPTASKKLIVKEEIKEIRHRYLFAIEDPFELDHNVARTVTHNGIVAIRDEFRRAWRIVKGMKDKGAQEDLLQEVVDQEVKKGGLKELMEDIHGVVVLGENNQTVGVFMDGEIVKPVQTSEFM